MNVNSATYTANVSSTEKNSSSSSLTGFDANAFMTILLAQLRNQNPLEPMDDKELISQMAQLNSLEELKKISTGIDKLINLNQG